MATEKLEESFRLYLSSRKKRDGSTYGPKYVYDKIARLRTLAKHVSARDLSNLNKSNYLSVIDDIIESFESNAEADQTRAAYADHLVVVRLLYEMNNVGKAAPRYTHYGRTRRPFLIK